MEAGRGGAAPRLRQVVAQAFLPVTPKVKAGGSIIMKKRVLVMVLIGALSIPAAISAATDDVSPELARKAVYWLYKASGNDGSEDSPRVRVSKPKTYYNYDQTVKYYAFYIYTRSLEIPTWKELAVRADEGNPVNMTGLYNIIISGNKQLAPYVQLNSGTPKVLMQKINAREILEKERPGENWRFKRTFVEVFFVFSVFASGSEEVIINSCGAIVDPEDFPFDMAVMDPSAIERNRNEWAEIEESEIPGY
jgi:hypothetical protein